MWQADRPARSPVRAEAGPAGIAAVALLSLLWAWWAWKSGAYFAVVMLPGAILLAAAVALFVSVLPLRIDLGLSPPARVALWALLALALWTALSALWSPAPDVAVVDGLRVAVYALAFFAGVACCNLLGRRMQLSLAPVAIGAGFAGLLTALALLTEADPKDLLEIDGTLADPLGYRNATAAFFAIALFPAAGLASDRELGWPFRAATLAIATLCLTLFLLCQSRASLPALVVGVIVYVLVSPYRARALSWLILAAVPALGVIPAFAALYSAAGDGGLGSVTSEMHFAGASALATTACSALLGALVARNEGRLPALGSMSRSANRTIARAVGVLAAAGTLGFLAAVGDPIDWLEERVTEFQSGTPAELGESSRFSLNAGSDRYDLWRVALEQVADDPLFGSGAGGFSYRYLRDREVFDQEARDAHSVQLETASELGLPGLVLLALALGGAVVATFRARQLGPSAATLSAIGLASCAYWLIHSSVDWFWPFAGVTAPVFALLGGAAGPSLLALVPRARRATRRMTVGALAIFALACVPPFFSERYVNNASEVWRGDLERAYSDLDRARALNPWSDWPYLVEAVIARETGDLVRAREMAAAAAEKRPEEWASHYLLAELLVDERPLLARNELRLALELNPFEERSRALAAELGLARELVPLPAG